MRRLLILTLGVLAVIVAADAMWWRSAERALAKGLATQMQGARTAGWSVMNSVPVSGGWPFAATLTVGDLLLSGGGIAWSADRLVLQTSLWHPLMLSVESEGMQRLRVGAWPEIPYTADTLRALVPLQAGVPPRGFSVHMVNLRVGLGEAASNSLTVRGLDLQAHWTPAAQQNEAAVAASLQAQDVSLPAAPFGAWPFGSAVAHLSADFALSGPLGRVKDLADRAVAWRDAGGTLDVKRLAVEWGGLDVTLGATLALDEQLQPMGAGTLHVIDPTAALDGLRETGVLPDRAAFAARALLALMIKPAASGEKSAIDLPFTLQDRRLSISRYGVLRLPHLALP
jgi:hypothetical protein